MSTKYQIITDGSCDLPKELAEEKGVVVVPFYVSFDGENYYREIQQMGVREFYDKMVDNPTVFPKSSLPSIQDYADEFFVYAKQNIPVICICITTKFSASMQSALNARDMVLEAYPEAQITVIDATVNTVLQGQLVMEAVAMQELGVSYEQNIERINEIKKTGRIFFTVGNLSYLQHGGRIGKLAGMAGSVLGIKPLITLKEGEIFPSGVTRSRKKSLEKILVLLDEYLKEVHADVEEYSFSVGLGYDKEEAEAFREQLQQFLKQNYKAVDNIPIYQIGAAIGVHTGPYALGIGVIKRHGYDRKG